MPQIVRHEPGLPEPLKQALKDGVRPPVQDMDDLLERRNQAKHDPVLIALEAKKRWEREPVKVFANQTKRYIIWDIKGRGTCSVRFTPRSAVKASAMQVEAMGNPPPGIDVYDYDKDNRNHIRLKVIGQ